MDNGVTNRLYGNYRAKVVENKDAEQFGRVVVWIPDLMTDISESQGIWARPANNPIGGRNTQYGSDNHYMGSCLIPRKGAWVWIFFESGNINRPYYFGGLDVEQAKVLPENQVGTNFQDKWTLFKSHQGRAIVISDDLDDQRVEITGRKRQLTNPPSGDINSVYDIEKNQTTILLDERSKKQKLLIKTYKGDFIKLDIDKRTIEIQVASDIHVRSGGHLFVSTTGDQHYLAGGKLRLSAVGDIDILSGGSITSQSAKEYNINSGSSLTEQIGTQKTVKTGGDIITQSATSIHTSAGIDINRDAANVINDNGGLAVVPPPLTVGAELAIQAHPDGSRDND